MKDDRIIGRLIVDRSDGADVLVNQMNEMVAELGHGEDLKDYIGRSDEIFHNQASAILGLTSEFDAFDVIELMREREAPFTLAGYEESRDDGQVALIEVISMLLLARGSRGRISDRPTSVAPNEIIPELHQRARIILATASLAVLAEGEAGKYGPLTRLASEYRSSELNVRCKQYTHINDTFNSELFGSAGIRDSLPDALGFSFNELVAVRQAIGDIYNEKLCLLRDVTVEVMSNSQNQSLETQSQDAIDRGIAAFRDMFVNPGRRASFTAEEIVRKTGLPADRIDKILSLFTIEFINRDSTEAVRAYFSGETDLHQASLISDGEGNYLSMHAPIGTDCLRQVLEDALKVRPRDWQRYDRNRTRVSEGLAVQYLTTLLGVSPAYTRLEYFRPRPGVATTALGKEAANVTGIADVAESDALFLMDDLAICVEVKGRSVSRGAKRGHVRKLSTDLEETVGGASAQARRLEQLIEANGGLWLKDRTWLDLSSVREIHSVAVCLEDMGVLGVAVDELVNCGIIKDRSIPWVVTLHDLAVIAEVLERPAEFLLYVRRRTDPGVSKYFRSSDELDLFMVFLNGLLYVESNPDRVFALYPASGKPTKAERDKYRAKAIPTRIHTHTDALDAWMYFEEGTSDVAAEKPKFSSSPRLLDLVDFLQDGHKPGWLRFGADLLDLSHEAQEHLIRELDKVVARTTSDHRWHTAALCYASEQGFPSLYICSQPSSMRYKSALERMQGYLIAKKHQLGSDRALGILIDEAAQIKAVQYDSNLPEDDSDLDEVGAALGLQPIQRPRKAPRSASKRAASRARASKRGRR